MAVFNCPFKLIDEKQVFFYDGSRPCISVKSCFLIISFISSTSKLVADTPRHRNRRRSSGDFQHPMSVGCFEIFLHPFLRRFSFLSFYWFKKGVRQRRFGRPAFFNRVLFFSSPKRPAPFRCSINFFRISLALLALLLRQAFHLFFILFPFSESF